jgi:CcmD family protein
LNYLFAGFVVVWLLLLGYLYSISRRQKRLDQEIAALKQRYEEK